MKMFIQLATLLVAGFSLSTNCFGGTITVVNNIPATTRNPNDPEFYMNTSSSCHIELIDTTANNNSVLSAPPAPSCSASYQFTTFSPEHTFKIKLGSTILNTPSFTTHNNANATFTVNANGPVTLTITRPTPN